MTHVVAERVGPDGLADRVVAAMRLHGSPSYPRAFEVWYAHLSGEMPALSANLLQVVVEAEGKVEGAALDRLYDRFIRTDQIVDQAERTSGQILHELTTLTEAITASLDASERPHRELCEISEQGPSSPERTKLHAWVETLVLSTRAEVARKAKLETRLRDSAREIRVLREALATTRLEAQTDTLTGLANRRHFEERLQTYVAQVAKSGLPLTLIMADIDFFKRFNDEHGHLTGDQVLRLVARTMTDKFPKTAVITRFGGEEFAIILPDTPLSGGWDCAEAVRQTLLARELIKRSTNESLGRVTLSLGVAAHRPGDTPETLTDRADHALLMAKRKGRNRTETQDALPQSPVVDG